MKANRSNSEGDALADWDCRRTDDGGARATLELSHRHGARVVVEVAPPSDAPALVRTPHGDVSYTTFTGVTAREAAELARAFADRLVTGEGYLDLPSEVLLGADNQRPTASRPAVTSTSVGTDAHAYALATSGFTVVPSVLGRRSLDALAEIADRAMKETIRQQALGATVPENTFIPQVYAGARSLHLWGDPCIRLLENEMIQELAQAVLGPHKLVDVVLFVSLPAGEAPDVSSEGWHRDAVRTLGEPYAARYLWFMLALDDFLPDNGATWVVPGSHRLTEPDSMLQAAKAGVHHYPSRVQMLLDAGDVLVLDPSTLHTRGHNVTDRSRRMVNVMLSHEASPPQWQWDFVGEKIRATASPRLRSLLGGSLSAEARATFAASSATGTQFEQTHATRTPAWPAVPPDWRE